MKISMDFKWIPITIIGLAILIILYYIEIPAPIIVKFILAILVLFVIGNFFIDYYKLDGQYGLILFKTKRGLKWIDRTAKRFTNFWIFMADTGLVWGFGLSGVYMVYRNIKEHNAKKHKKTNMKNIIFPIISGILLLVLTLLFISPIIMPVATSVISHVNLSKTTDSVKAVPHNNLMIVLWIAMLLFGFVGYSISSLLIYAVIVIYNLIMIVLGAGVSPVEPGGTLLLPGVNLPFVEGIISLFVLLFVHEISHGLLARIAKVRLDSGGIVLFGFIPIGAFIEPDEKELKKKTRLEQTRVMVAGSAANLFTMFAFFLILSAFLSITEDYRNITVVITGGNLPKGAQLLSINDVNITYKNIKHIELEPNQKVNIVTTNGTFNMMTNDKGKIGFYYTMGDSLSYDSPSLRFIYNILALIFMLNFFVGLINLVPIPGLDGYHILDINVKNKLFVKFVMYIVLACFLSAFLPWIYK
ncbi:site-2 protease family protein [Candidatus Micrarchaeota archaeon]|nr:site-2 protease family protein [Candidatus Micrarchaeota archaeon]